MARQVEVIIKTNSETILSKFRTAARVVENWYHNRYALMRMQTHFHCLDKDDE
jgi:hypothetical protein